MNKKNTDENNGKKIKSYDEKEKDQFITNLAQVLSNSKYNDKDNEDM